MAAVNYLGDEVGEEMQRLHQDTLNAALWLQLHLRGLRRLVHKVEQRLHLPPGEGQHRVQVVHYAV